jgi:hypothetical protein
MFELPIRVKVIALIKVISALGLLLVAGLLLLLSFADNRWFGGSEALFAALLVGGAGGVTGLLGYGLFSRVNAARLLSAGGAAVGLCGIVLTAGGWGGATAALWHAFVLATLAFDDDVRRAFGG